MAEQTKGALMLRRGINSHDAVVNGVLHSGAANPDESALARPPQRFDEEMATATAHH